MNNIAEMGRKMSEQNYEPEINIGRVIYRILRDWRKIFVAALVMSILFGMVTFVAKRLAASDPEFREKAEENYLRELAAFEAAGETMQHEIENLEETRGEREAYNEASVLMQINPFREFNASLQLYVATDYKIVPELTFQDIDLSSRILRSYITYMVNGDMYQFILEHLSQPMELRYLKEILTVWADYDNRMVNLAVRHVDAEACEEILQYALLGVEEKKKGIVDAIGEHELNAVNQSVYETVNLELDEWQKANRQYMLNLSIELQEKSEALAEWQVSPKPQREYTDGRILRVSIKGMVLGFMVGVVLAAIFIAFHYVLSDKVQEARELGKRFGLRVIAQIPKVQKKRIWVVFDRLFANMGGLTQKERDEGQLILLAGKSVCAEVEALRAATLKEAGMAEKTAGMDTVIGSGFLEDNKSKSHIIFTGNVKMEELENLLSGMCWNEGYQVSCAPCILCDPSAVFAVTKADYVVLVEKQETGTYAQIEQELSEFAAWGKKVLGVIVLGVDAIP